jgi:DNA helicase-2/ATP-dependent DNA helicase PcrA
MMSRFSDLIETQDAYQAAEAILRESGVMTAAALDITPEGIDRKQNLDELVAGLHEFVQQREAEGIAFTPIQDFLAEVSLLTDQDQNLQDHTERVTLMTVHAAKGLEFKVVHIVGLEENLFPSKFCETAAEIEEESRLLYVAITRAMEQCTLSYTRQRFANGTVNFSSPSRFLRDIDRQYLQIAGESGYSAAASNTTYHRPAPVAKPVSAIPVKPTTNVSAAETENATYSFGERVRHRVFGDGTVQRIYIDESTGNEKIEIKFDTQGLKTLLLTYAKLERLT